MVLFLSTYLSSIISSAQVFHYVSVRAICGLLSALGLSLLFGNRFISESRERLCSGPREWTPESHKKKGSMPTMGGIFILGVVLINILIWTDVSRADVWLCIANLIGFGAIGAWDDWGKIKHKRGIDARTKFRLQCLVAGLVMFAWVFIYQQTSICFPFFKNIQPNIGLLFVPWAVFIIVGCSNGVNLTDGLDGLAIGSLISTYATFAMVAYAAGHSKIAEYLHIPYAHSSEMCIISAIFVGASLGFLWFNTYPAQIFMGDVGSLSLGASLAFIAILAKQELLLPIAGGLFVLETLSVMLQVLSVRYLKRRMFKMAPIHHHFELLGWPESQITVRFNIISFVFCLLALITLKLR